MTPSALLVFIIVPFAVLATVLGWVAVARIRRSGGRLHGLWLAILDGLLFPLLGLYAFTVFFLRALATVALGWPWDDPVHNTVNFLGATLLFAVTAFFIVRGTWRWASIPEPPAPLSTKRKVGLGCGTLIVIVALLHVAMVVLVLSWNLKRKGEEQALVVKKILAEKKMTEAQKAQKSSPARFGPTQAVLADRSGREGVDLDTGRLVAFDPKAVGVPEIEMANRWLQAEGVDVFADPNSFRPGLLFTAVSPALQEVDAVYWDADPNLLLGFLPPPPPAGVYTDQMTFIETPQGTGHPKTYLMRTQQGGAAILQIREATDSRSTKFRYKSILPGS